MKKTNKRDINCLVIHHNDNDGICSAAIVNYFESDCTMHSINYGYDIPWKLIKRAKRIYMVDFGLQPFSEMIKIKEMLGEEFIWIDHHKTAIDDMNNSGQKFRGIQEIGEAGCELTWRWFDQSTPIPKAVRMLGRYDVWDLDYHEDVLPFQSGVHFLQPEADESIFWGILFEECESHYQNILEKGKFCLEYKTKMNTSYCKSHSFDIEWEDHRFLCANSLSNNSALFDTKFDWYSYDAVLTFGFSNGGWTISMYTNKPNIDVGVIAKRNGGGGHVGAAGFKCKELPFELPFKDR